MSHPRGTAVLPEAGQQLRPWWNIPSSGHGLWLDHLVSSLS